MSARRSRRARRHPIRWRLEYVAARTVMALAGALPDRLGRAFGAALGGLAARFAQRRVRMADANLALVHPDWSAERRAALVRRNFAELGRCMIEWARLPARSPAELLRRVDFEGAEHFEAAQAKGKGVFAVTAHYGLWELIPAAARARFPGCEISAVGRELRNPYLFKDIVRRRTIGGGEILPQEARPILRAIRRGAAVGVLLDQYTSARRGGVLAPFLGLRAWTNAGPATLALRTGAAVVPVHVRRVEGGRHVIVFGPEIEPPAEGDVRGDVAGFVARINDALSAMIEAEPEHWVWSTRRYRNSPDVAGDPYA